MALTKITTSVIAANTLGTANIADNSIDATKIAANSILTRHIDDDQITGDQLADNITIAGNLTVTGNLTTNGSSVTNSSTNTTIEDTLIELGTGTSGSPSNDSGIILERGSSDNIFIGFDESADKVMVATTSATGASTGNLTLTAAPLVTGALTASGLSYPTSDGSSGQVIKTDGSGALSFSNISTSTSVSNYTATGDGSTTAFDTGTNPTDEINTWVFVDGVYQQKSVYSYSGSTITFATAPESGAKIDVVTGITSGIQDSNTVLGIFEATTTNTATYATSLNAAHENNTWVFVGGVYQPKDSYTFSTSGSLVFDANTPVGEKLAVVTTKALTASAVTTDSIAASAVTTAKIADNAITSAKIPNNSIVGADISATTNITANTFTGALTGNVTGNVTGNLTGTIQTAAQTNITSVGTLTSFRSTGIDDNADAIAITIDSSERVGIGMTPSDHSGYMLQITGGSQSFIAIGNDTTGTGALNGLILGNDSTGADIYQRENQPLRLHTNNTERMRIDSAGLVSMTHAAGAHTGGLSIINSQAGGYGSALTFQSERSDDNSIVSAAQIRTQGQDSWNSAASADSNLFFATALNGSLTDKMVIKHDGAVGIGETSPLGKLHIKGTDVGASPASTANQLVLEDTENGISILSNTAGAGNINFGDSDDNGKGGFIYDHSADAMRHIVNGGEKMRIDSSGRVLVGTTTSSGLLSLYNSGQTGLNINTPTGTNTFAAFQRNGSTVGSITTNGSTTSFNTSSDARLKDVTGEARGLEVINELNPVAYNWKESGQADEGLIAQEVLDIVPNAVSGLEEEMYSMDYSKLVVHLVAGMKEQQAQIDELKAKLEDK